MLLLPDRRFIKLYNLTPFQQSQFYLHLLWVKLHKFYGCCGDKAIDHRQLAERWRLSFGPWSLVSVSVSNQVCLLLGL